MTPQSPPTPPGDACVSSPRRSGGRTWGVRWPVRPLQRRSGRAAGLGGIVIARALGPTIRGEYAAVTAWFGVALISATWASPRRSASMSRTIQAMPAVMSPRRGR